MVEEANYWTKYMSKFKMTVDGLIHKVTGTLH